MKIVCITGGIGSGKTTVAKMFAELGISVYYADDEAKKLMDSSSKIREGLIDLLGADTYRNGVLDRKFMADKIFNDKNLLKKANAIIHPQVAAHFQNWVSDQTGPYVLKEAAILFESGSYKQCDQIILVTASKEIRVQRVMSRDGVSRKEVEARMKNQWDDSKKEKLADIILPNEQLPQTRKRVQALHTRLL